MVPVFGISAKLKDKRVDRLLRQAGYEPEKCEIFYSPAKGIYFFLFWLAIFLIIQIGFIFLFWRYRVYLLIYAVLTFLFAESLNNSFVLTEGQLVVIRPGFLFKRVKVYDLAAITKIKIDYSPMLWALVLFIGPSRNYVEVITENRTKRFYCISLEIDAFDENMTEKTIDNFHAALVKREVNVEFNLD